VNILAIGAHPDDVELGCGGLILKAAKNGHNVFLYTLTRGGASGDPHLRTQEVVESSKIIGCKALWIDNFSDTHLSVNSELINHIEIFVNRASADLILTHSQCDTHHDHRAVAAATLEAGRFVPNILAYEIPLTRDFRPQIFYDISDVVDEKIRMIELFKSQREKVYLHADAIKGLGAYRALQSRLNASNEIERPVHVEAFEVLKMCIDSGFKLANIGQIPKYVPLRAATQEISEFAGLV
jgi:LmbE family N-acetylglucosaminyl deacetylase